MTYTLWLGLLGWLWAGAPDAVSLPLQHLVNGHTLTSSSSPAVVLTVADEFRYVGGKRVVLYGVADAELHLFAAANPDGLVRAFYWFQFEHFLPDNEKHYDAAASAAAIDVGGIAFSYDTLGYADFEAIQRSQPGSDGAAATAVLDAGKLRFPARTARVRMFHYPDAARRSELMIIYGEAIGPGANGPDAAPRFKLDESSATAVVADMRRGLSMQQRTP